MMKVIISNGHFKFILGPAAEEANYRKILVDFITAGYPTRKVKKLISFLGLSRFGGVKRLLNREELIPEALVHPLWFPELIIQTGVIIRNITKTTKYSEWVNDIALRLYGSQASQIVENSKANIYHYRSGYGHNSVKVAKQKGMVALCDHSIAHPAVLQYLINNQGRLPVNGEAGPMNKFWSNVLSDINQADEVLVNSDFVKETFINQGWEPGRVHVVYTGLDKEFLHAIPECASKSVAKESIKLMFAGELGARKGGEILIRALQKITDLPWQLEIIGSITPAIKEQFDTFLSDNRVTVSGFLPRLDLAKYMSKADIFIFPSLAEGSARVIFMAMVCGCYVITTPNSGSIIKDGFHGALVSPGSVDELEKAIRQSLIMERETISNIGRTNSELIRTDYTQDQYGENIFNVYENVLMQADDSDD